MEVINSKKTTEELTYNIVKEYPAFFSEGTTPSVFIDNIVYALELKKKRLEKHHLEQKSEINLRGLLPEGFEHHKWSDGVHYSYEIARTCSWKDELFRSGKKVYKEVGNYFLQATVTDLIKDANVERETYVCPNCGNATTIGELKKGCSYCGTFFETKDLFPKVSGYYQDKNYGKTSRELKINILKTIIPFTIVFDCIFLSYFYFHNQLPKGSIGSWILLLTGMSLMGAFYGMFFYTGKLVVKLLRDAVQGIPMLSKKNASRKRFESAMKEYSSEFSFTYFSDRVVSFLQMILFSETPDALPIYEGESINGKFEDIVDAKFRGAMGVRTFKVEGDYCTVSVEVYMQVIHDDGKKLRRKNEVYYLKLEKNINHKFDLGFSPKAITCKSCGGSFDATKNAVCPYCDSKYDLRDEDWIVTKVAKI